VFDEYVAQPNHCLTVSTDWILKTSRSIYPYPPTPTEVETNLRKNKMQYTEFANRMIRAVHGKIRYTESVTKKQFDDLVSPSQEAFALLLYRNGYQNWIWLHHEASSSSGVSDTTDGEGRSQGISTHHEVEI
jgi:hypothetical protein